MLKKILNRDTSKTFRDPDVPTKILKEYADTFVVSLNSVLMHLSKIPSFHQFLRQDQVTFLGHGPDRSYFK